jgi:hypothetical protein
MMITVACNILLGYSKCNVDRVHVFIDVKLTKLNKDDHLIPGRISAK